MLYKHFVLFAQINTNFQYIGESFYLLSTSNKEDYALPHFKHAP